MSKPVTLPPYQELSYIDDDISNTIIQPDQIYNSYLLATSVTVGCIGLWKVQCP